MTFWKNAEVAIWWVFFSDDQSQSMDDAPDRTLFEQRCGRSPGRRNRSLIRVLLRFRKIGEEGIRMELRALASWKIRELATS